MKQHGLREIPFSDIRSSTGYCSRESALRRMDGISEKAMRWATVA